MIPTLRSIRRWFSKANQELRDRNRELEAALDELVYLKNMKDMLGKTTEYAVRQRLAWGAARRALGKEAAGYSRPILRIEINFPAPVEITHVDERRLDMIAGDICDRWREANPDRIMWPSGHGQKVTYMPMTRAEEEAGRHLEFDPDVYAIDCAQRERYSTDRH
jgi:hypothetical protein